MKKPILYGALGLIVAVIAAAAAAPKVIGSGVREAILDGSLELLPPQSRSQFQITETRFDSGWFSSEAELDVRYIALAEQEDLAVQLQINISHGPLLFTPDGLRLGLAYAEIVPSFNSPELSQALSELPIELPELHIDLLAELDQSLRLTLSMAPFNFSDASGQVSFAGMNSSVLAKPDLSAEIEFNMGELQASQPATQMGFSMAGLNLQSSTQQINDMLAPSMALLTVPSISSESPYPFNVSNISIDSRIQPSAASAEKIDVHQSFRIGSIMSELPVASAHMSMDFNEVRRDLILNYYGMIAQMQNAMNGNPAAANNPFEEYAEEMATILIQDSMVFNNLLEANAFDGDHSIDVNIDWRGLPGVTDLDSVEAMQILEVFSFSVTVSLDEAAIQRSPLATLVDPYVQQGYLRIDGGRILMDATLSEAQLTVNGETVPLEQFL